MSQGKQSILKKNKLIFSPNTSPNIITLLEDKLNCCRSQNLGTYLGFPLVHKRPSKGQLEFIVDKVRAKLSKWKVGYLSKAGKVCLIKASLSAIPSYYMTCLPLHKSILNMLTSSGNLEFISFIQGTPPCLVGWYLQTYLGRGVGNQELSSYKSNNGP